MQDNNNNLEAKSKINRDLLNFSSEKKLCQTICNDLVGIKGYKFVWMGLRENGNGIFSPITIAGKNKGFIKSVKDSWGKYSFVGDPASIALKSYKNFLNKDLKNVQRFVSWDNMAIEEGFLSAFILPVKYHNDINGTLHVYSDTKNYFSKEERSFLKEVAGDIELGLKKLKDNRRCTERKIEYRELVEKISSCVAIYEATDNGNDFIFKDFNRAAEKTEKIKRKDIFGKSVLKVFPGVKDFGLFDVFKRVYKTGNSENHTISLYKDSRISGWRENFIYKIPSGNIVAVYNDLTKEKSEEEKLVKTNERLKLAQKSAGSGMWDWDINTGEMNWTPELFNLFGLDHRKDSATSNTWYSVLHPDDMKTAKRRIKKSIKDHYPLQHEYRIIMPSGKIRWIDIRGNTIYDNQEKAVRMAGICINITDKKEMQKSIGETELKYRELFDSAPVGIVVIDKVGTIISTNNTLDSIGFPKKTTIGKKFTDIGILKVKDIPKYVNIFFNILRGKQIKPFNVCWNDSQGKEIIGEINASLLKRNGKVIGCQLIIKNITEQEKSAEKILSISRFPSENPNPVIRTDYNGRILYFNDACKDITGWKQEVGSFVLRPFLEKVLNSVKSNKAFSILQFGGQSYESNFVNIKEYKYINIYLRDITDKKKIEDELVKKSNQLKILMDNTHDWIFIKNKNSEFILNNNAHKKSLGVLPGEDIKGKTDFNFFTKLTAQKLFDEEQNIIKTGISFIDKEELLYTKTSKNKVWVEGSKVPLRDKNGINGIVGISRNITARKEAEEKLKVSYIKLQKTLNDTIKTLASIVETRDPYTSGHQKRVAQLATSIAKEIGFTEDRTEVIRISAQLHDIGKINIPTSILARPGKISDIEYSMIKTHSKLGCDVLKNIEFPWPIADIVLQHHERIDGSGYPGGLKGKDILPEAKIIMVADVVEAMSSHRPYRPALGIDKAIQEIKKNKGMLYDRVIADACIKLFKEKRFKFKT